MAQVQGWSLDQPSPFEKQEACLTQILYWPLLSRPPREFKRARAYMLMSHHFLGPVETYFFPQITEPSEWFQLGGTVHFIYCLHLLRLFMSVTRHLHGENTAGKLLRVSCPETLCGSCRLLNVKADVVLQVRWGCCMWVWHRHVLHACERVCVCMFVCVCVCVCECVCVCGVCVLVCVSKSQKHTKYHHLAFGKSFLTSPEAPKALTRSQVHTHTYSLTHTHTHTRSYDKVWHEMTCNDMP